MKPGWLIPLVVCALARAALAAPLSLAQAIAIARRRHPDVIEGDAQRRSATARSGVALAAYLPSVDLALLGRYDYSNFSPVVVGTPTDTTPADTTYPYVGYGRYQGQLTLSQLLFDGGATLGQLAAARAQAVAAAATLEAKRIAVEGSVVAAYFGALEGKALLDVSAEYEGRTVELVRSVRALVKGGVRPEMDALSAEIRHQRATLDRIRARSTLAQRRAQLMAAMGLDRDEGDTLLEAMVEPPPEEAESLDGLVARAFDRRPELASLRAQVAAAKANVTAARSDYFPSVSLQVRGIMSGTNDVPGPLFSVFGAVTLEDKLFSGLATYRGMQQARADREAVEARLAAQRSQLRAAIATTFAALEAARDSVAAAKILVDQAERALASAQRRYDTGLLSFLELIDLHNQRVVARTADVQARYALGLARADLLRAIGGTLEGHTALSRGRP